MEVGFVSLGAVASAVLYHVQSITITKTVCL